MGACVGASTGPATGRTGPSIGLATLGIPRSAGVPEAFVSHTLLARYNDLPSVERAFRTHPTDVAAILVEPVACNMGGGLPVGAFGGRRELMERLAPLGDVYQAGTLSGNPVLAERLCDGVAKAATEFGVPMHVGRAGPAFTFFFASEPVTDYASACASDTGRYAAFFRAMLKDGVLLPPSQFEAGFISACHTEEHVERAVAAARTALRHLGQGPR